MSSSGEPRRRLDLGTAFAEGLSLAVSRNGLVFVAAFFALEAVTVLLAISGAVYLPLDQAAGVGVPSGLPVGATLPSAGLIVAEALSTVFTALVSIPLTIVATRTFVAGETGRIPDDYLFHRLGRATLSGVLASLLIVGGLAVLFGVGFGGLFVLDAYHEQLGPVAIVGTLVAIAGVVVVGFVAIVLHVLFVNHEIAVRDRGLRDALGGSWALVRSNRVRMSVFVVLVVVIGLLVRPDGGSAAGNALHPLSTGRLLVGTVLYSILWVAMTAVLARAYRQLSPDDAVRSGTIGD